MDDRDIARFWSKVDVRGPDECWPWNKPLKGEPYGRMRLDGRMVRAHRIAFYIAHGRWPEPCGCHHCDNPPCCNQRHLFEGTNADNTRDKWLKGRTRGGVLLGEMHSQARLTNELVRRARALRVDGLTYEAIGAIVGASKSAIQRAVTRETWSHIE